MPANEPKIFTGTVSQRFADEDRVATVQVYGSNAGELETRMANAEKVLGRMIERHNTKVLDTGEVTRERVMALKAQIERDYLKRLVEGGLVDRAHLPPEVNGADSPPVAAHPRADS